MKKKKRKRGEVSAEDDEDLPATEDNMKMKMIAAEKKLAVYKLQEERRAIKASLEAERQPSVALVNAELAELRRKVLEAEIQSKITAGIKAKKAETKNKFKAKKAKMRQKLEELEDGRSLARENHQASSDAHIKNLMDINLSSAYQQASYQQAYGQQVYGQQAYG